MDFPGLEMVMSFLFKQYLTPKETESTLGYFLE